MSSASPLIAPPEIKISCFHCGDPCSDIIEKDGKAFCCEGCRAVYELLDGSGLCTYYDLERSPGIKINASAKEEYAYLENDLIKKQVLQFYDGDLCRVSFYIPAIHCSSCIWLLENLHKLREGIIQTNINFPEKKLSLVFRESGISLRQVVELLSHIGYAPQITLEQSEQSGKPARNRSLFYKIGIAGFAFGNIMLFSFPEYLALQDEVGSAFLKFFNYLSLILAIPVVFYSASGYFISAYRGIQNKILNIDVPISFGMLALFTKSSLDVLLYNEAGYFDSLTGLIFFLLIGKWFQSKTYEALSFARDYKSYFPLAITKVEEGKKLYVPVTDLRPGDKIIVHHGELIPADAVITDGKADIDYSFVSGESLPVSCKAGDKVFAGGRQTGGYAEMEIQEDVSASYMVQLWNQEAFKKQERSPVLRFTDMVSKYFVLSVLLISVFTFIYWMRLDASMATLALTSVLIVACPCTLALAIPFAFGSALRILGRKGLFIKNAEGIAGLAGINTIVFDKTGTITSGNSAGLEFSGVLTKEEEKMIRLLCAQSTHPYSRIIAHTGYTCEFDKVDDFNSYTGKGISGIVNGYLIKAGSLRFVNGSGPDESGTGNVYISVNGRIRGFYTVRTKYREGIFPLLERLGRRFVTFLLSGDNGMESERLRKHFTDGMSFHQSPVDKLNFIEGLQRQGKKVLMAGDGLNDAGALQQSDFGIAVSDNVNNFSPACDAILRSSGLKDLDKYLRFSRHTYRTVVASLIISLLYNIAAISFAVTGNLTPLVAAVLMPVSSIGVVLFVVGGTAWFGRGLKLKEE